MSHLLTEWSRKVKRGLRPASCIGIAIGRDCLGAVHGYPSDENLRVEWSGAIPGEYALIGTTHSDLYSPLERLASVVRERIGKSYVPVQLALPDPLVHAVVIALDELPSGMKERQELVRWHLSHQLHVDADAVEVTGQWLGREEDQQLFLGLGVARELLAVVEAAFAAAGLRPSVIDMAACYRHNYILPMLGARSGALMCVEPDYWTLSLWDEQGRPRQLRARWRERGNGEHDEPRALAAEIERTVLSYVHGGDGRRIERLYVASSQEDASCLCAAVDERTQEACVPVVFPSALTASTDGVPLPIAAVASALCR